MNIFDKFNQSNYVFYFLVVDNSLDILLPQLKNFHLIYAFNNHQTKILDQQKIPYFCLETSGVKLDVANSGKLLSHPFVIDYINKQTKNKTAVIIPFKPSARIDFICQQHNFICASNNHQLNRQLEDKILFGDLCQQNNLPQIPSAVDSFTKDNFLKYQRLFTKTLVIQSHFGWAGQSTFSSDTWDDLKNKIHPSTKVKFLPFINGYSLLNNCCLTPSGLIQSPPALQYTGIKPFTQNPFTTVGRQWPSLAPKNIIDQVHQITQDFSSVLQKMDYRGFFGLDFMVENDHLYLLECNPRLTASFAFYHEIEINQNLTPLFLIHLAQFIDLDLKLDLTKEQRRFYNQNIIGSEITAKDQHGKTIKKYHHFSIFTQKINPISFSSEIVSLLND